MTYTDVLEAYNDIIKKGDTPVDIVLSIQMPMGEVETISNPSVKAKIDYIKNAYTEDLVHKNNENIKIIDVFFVLKEDSYNNLTFSAALTFLTITPGKYKLARKGWNAANQFVYSVGPNSYTVCSDAVKDLVDEEGKVKYNMYFAIKTVQGTISTWVPSITDLTANDWYVIDPPKDQEVE